MAKTAIRWLPLILTVALLGGTIAYAQSPTVYYACVTKSSGVLRVVPNANACKSNEYSISWNQQGPTGPTGPQGPAGPAGPQGPAGPAGSRAAPPCFDNANRYVDCMNGTVTDTATGLIWLKDASCLGSRTYADANTAAAVLLMGACGLTDNSSPRDWRLPTKAEWEETIAQAVVLGCTSANAPSLTNTPGFGCYNAGPQQFTGVQSNEFWTRTTYASHPLHAWVVSLFSGNVGVGGFKADNFYVWPVRGGQ